MSEITAPLTVRDATAKTSAARQFVRFAFFHVHPSWRLRSEQDRALDREELAAVIREAAGQEGIVLRSYSLVGTRGDADFMLWIIGEDIALHHAFSARINHTRMAAFLEQPHHYFAMTKRSTYAERHVHADGGGEGRSNRLIVVPGGRKFLFVYPFVKTRAWYRLSQDERQRQMDEHISMGHKYPSVKINTTYSFGLDDQEFVVAFETDVASDFLDLVHEMRESEASTFTVRDVPSFSCIASGIDEMLAAL